MPTYRPCVSCGEPCQVNAATAANGPKCRSCRRRYCLRCGRPYVRDHHGTPVCAACLSSAREAVAA